MAGTITHVFFEEDVFKKLDNQTKKNLEKYKENLKTYAQGHDIMFFSFNFTGQKKIGNFLHKNKTKDFFINMINYIVNNNLQNNFELISFLYGYICHYSLDLTVHPYITYKCGIFNKKKKDTYKYNSKHSNMESYIDAYMVKERMSIDPNKFKIHKFCFNTKMSKELSKMIDYIYINTYKFKNFSFYYKQGIFNMKILYRILRYDPFKIKKKIYNIIDKLLPKKLNKLSPISYAYELNNDKYYLNLDHKKWQHPRYKDEVYNLSFLELYNNALDLAVDTINKVNNILYNNDDINKLNDIFRNLSYSSGKDCKDKAKNRYFEF